MFIATPILLNLKQYNMDKPKFSYSQAIHWLGNYFIRMPEIMKPHLSARFNEYDEDGDKIPIFQYFLSNCSEREVRFLEKTFGLLFYEYKYEDYYILAVDHCGTSWTMIEWINYISNEDLKEKIENGQI